jgi:3-oxoacyl-[acyl-carrier-protein] synthase-1
MNVVISGLGMVSAIGRDVVTACASLRAGLSRPAELAHYPVLEDEDGEAVPLIGHPVRGMTEGFHLPGAWVRLGHASIRDLLLYGGLPRGDAAFWERTLLVVATPVIDEERFPDAPLLLTEERIRDDCALRIAGLLGMPLPASNVAIVSNGHAGTALGVQGAAQMIDEGRFDRVIVAAVDSCTGASSLDWFAEHERLKTPELPAALFPGEAAAAFLLEAEPAAVRRGARIEARIAGAAVAREESHFFTDQVNHGLALSAAAGQVLPEGSAFSGDVFVDLNGEPWRAYELGCARTRLSDRMLESAHLVMPASSLGETGAASGAVAVCAAVRSFVRGYASAGEALVLSSSEYGHVGAIRLAAA